MERKINVNEKMQRKISAIPTDYTLYKMKGVRFAEESVYISGSLCYNASVQIVGDTVIWMTH